ncbi:putative proteinC TRANSCRIPTION FACTOR 56 [Salix purpurea]|uniref:NAC domain-containing protein n=1 Tax=Salix purpurea TaxID=77065 RepID=A0A9Q0V2G4_SALPP|nr:putative proteinC TRANSCRIPTION FACTOR 56 [Salix purpurea]
MKGNIRSADQLELPAGFRFHPTDDELVNHYLLKKCGGQSISAPIIAEIDLYKYDPWQLPGMALYGEKEWYFFSPRDRKYPNGSRPNRAAGTGSAGKKNNLRLDDWVLCRIYNKKGSVEKHFPSERKSTASYPEMEDRKPDINEISGYQNGMSQVAAAAMTQFPRLNTDSSSSEHVLSPEVTCDKEVQSQQKWNEQLDNAAFDFNFDYADDGFQDDPFASQIQFQMDQLSPLQDMFMYLQKPF